MQGYTDHSISLQQTFSTPLGRIMLVGEALNLTGKNYEIVRNYPMPGRSYRMTLSIHF
jgi:outer membrane cobalamin receptor